MRTLCLLLLTSVSVLADNGLDFTCLPGEGFEDFTVFCSADARASTVAQAIKDISPSGNDFSSSGSVSMHTTSGPNGGPCLLFNANAEYLYRNNSVQTAQKRSVALCWVDLTSVPGAGVYATIFFCGQNTYNDRFRNIVVIPGGYVAVSTRFGVVNELATGSTALDTSWHFCAGRWDDELFTQREVYIDGATDGYNGVSVQHQANRTSWGYNIRLSPAAQLYAYIATMMIFDSNTSWPSQFDDSGPDEEIIEQLYYVTKYFP